MDAPDDTPIPPMPTAQWIVLPTASTSAAAAAGTANGETAENAGEKRKAAPDGEEPTKKAKGDEAEDDEDDDAPAGHRIHTVLKVADFTGPPTPSVEDIEGAILKRQKGAFLSPT